MYELELADEKELVGAKVGTFPPQISVLLAERLG